MFGTLPLWIAEVGLYSYLGIEVLIWCLYALGYNLALGYTGLPSFGHGAFFGIGGYAFGLTQFHLAPNLWLCMLASQDVMVELDLPHVCKPHREAIPPAVVYVDRGDEERGEKTVLVEKNRIAVEETFYAPGEGRAAQ